MNPWIVVPAYNEAKLIGSLMLRLLELEDIEACDVVFCDNGSTDATAAIIRDFIEVRELRWHLVAEPQKGTGAAADTAMRYAIERGATHLLRTDADCLPARDWLVLYRQLFTQSDVRLIAGRVLVRDDEGLPRLQRMGLNLIYDLTRRSASLYYARSTDPAQPYLGPHRMVSGGNMGITAELYEQVGGFTRSRIEDVHEDLDLLLRVRRVTTLYSYAPQITVTMSARRVRAWGIMRTIQWYTEHSWRPTAGGAVDIR